MKNILVIGSGGMGRRHIRAFSGIENTGISCFDIDPTRLLGIQADFPTVRCFANLDAVPVWNLHAVVIVTPTDTHIDYAEWCIDHNLAFLVEKPISNSMDRVPELVQKAMDSRLTAGVAFPRRNSDAIAKIKSLVEKGFIGELKMIASAFSQDFRKYRPDYQKTYYAKLSAGGGLLMDALSHHVDLMTYFGGPVKSVSSLSDRLVFEGCEGEDTAVLALRFQNDIIGNILGNQFQKANTDQIELMGTLGNIRYERLTGILSWSTSDKPVWEQEWIDGDWDAIIRNQAINFLNSLSPGSDGIHLKTSLVEAMHSLRVVLAARESNREGRSIEVGI